MKKKKEREKRLNCVPRKSKHPTNSSGRRQCPVLSEKRPDRVCSLDQSVGYYAIQRDSRPALLFLGPVVDSVIVVPLVKGQAFCLLSHRSKTADRTVSIVFDEALELMAVCDSLPPSPTLLPVSLQDYRSFPPLFLGLWKLTPPPPPQSMEAHTPSSSHPHPTPPFSDTPPPPPSPSSHPTPTLPQGL